MQCITVRFTFINYFKKIFLRNTNKAIAMFISKTSLERMPIDVIRYEPHTLLALGPFNSFIDYIFIVAKLFDMRKNET